MAGTMLSDASWAPIVLGDRAYTGSAKADFVDIAFSSAVAESSL